MVKVELDTEIELSVSADGAGYGTTDVSVTAAGYIKHIGDYCNECGELLANAIAESIQLPERCSKDFRDKDARVKAEVEMIEEQRERTW